MHDIYLIPPQKAGRGTRPVFKVWKLPARMLGQKFHCLKCSTARNQRVQQSFGKLRVLLYSEPAKVGCGTRSFFKLGRFRPRTLGENSPLTLDTRCRESVTPDETFPIDISSSEFLSARRQRIRQAEFWQTQTVG